MTTQPDPDAEGGPDPEWFKAELRACRDRITELEAHQTALSKQLAQARDLIANMRERVDSGQ